MLEYFKDTNPYVVNQEKSYYKWYRSEVDTTPEEGNNIDVEELKVENQKLKTELKAVYGSQETRFNLSNT